MLNMNCSVTSTNTTSRADIAILLERTEALFGKSEFSRAGQV